MKKVTRADLLLYLPPALLLASFLFIHVAALRSVMLAATLLVAINAWRLRGATSIPFKIPLAIWAGFAFLSLSWSVNPAYSFSEIRVEVLYDIAIFLAFLTLTRERWQWNLFRGALLAALAVMTVIAFGLYARTGDLNAESALGGMLSISTHVVTLLPLLVAGIWEFRDKPIVSTPASLIAIGSMAMGYFSLNRNFLPSVDIVTIILATMLIRHRMASRRGVIALAALVILSSIPLFMSVAQTRAEKTDTSVASSLTGDPRLGIWQFSINLVRERPLTGAGFGRFAAVEEYRRQFPNDPTNAHAHNPFLNYAVQMGIGGVVVLALLLWALAAKFWKLSKADDLQARWIGISGVAMVVGVVVKTQTDDIWGRQHGYLFWALTGMMLGYAQCRLASKSTGGNAADAP